MGVRTLSRALCGAHLAIGVMSREQPGEEHDTMRDRRSHSGIVRCLRGGLLCTWIWMCKGVLIVLPSMSGMSRPSTNRHQQRADRSGSVGAAEADSNNQPPRGGSPDKPQTRGVLGKQLLFAVVLAQSRRMRE